MSDFLTPMGKARMRLDAAACAEERREILALVEQKEQRWRSGEATAPPRSSLYACLVGRVEAAREIAAAIRARDNQ